MARVIKVEKKMLYFDDGRRLFSDHIKDCCEDHYLDFSNLTLEDFEGLEFDLNNDNFFEKVEGYGIRLIPKNGFPVSVPGYGYNNGHYTTNLTLIIAKKYIEKEYDITECQDIEG